MSTPEKYLPPKELAAELCEKFGLCLTADYLRRVRRKSAQDRDGLFIGGCARPSEVLEWLKVHPNFKRRDCLVAA